MPASNSVNNTHSSMERLADSARRSSTARATCSVASPAPSPSSSSTARRSLLCDARPSTSPASSSAPSVRTPTERASETRSKPWSAIESMGLQGDDVVDNMHSACSLAERSRDMFLERWQLTGLYSEVLCFPAQADPLQPHSRWYVFLSMHCAFALKTRMRDLPRHVC